MAPPVSDEGLVVVGDIMKDLLVLALGFHPEINYIGDSQLILHSPSGNMWMNLEASGDDLSCIGEPAIKILEV